MNEENDGEEVNDLSSAQFLRATETAVKKATETQRFKVEINYPEFKIDAGNQMGAGIQMMRPNSKVRFSDICVFRN